MTSWFTMARAARDAAAADIAIYDEIGGYGIGADGFRRALAALGDVKRIDLRVNSPGGQVFDGIAIGNMLARHPARVTATVDGIAASIASIVCMAADEVVMPENALMMVHNPAGGVMGTADDMRDWADALDKMTTAMIASYARKTGKSPEALKAMLDAETWMTAAEAKANGFADRILPARKMQAQYDVAARFPKAPTAAIALLGAELVEPTAEHQPTNSAAAGAASTEKDMDQAEVEKIVAEALAAEKKRSEEAIAADRKRSADILALDEAKGREALATALAAQGLSVEAAKAVLAAAPKVSSLEARAGGFNPGAALGGGSGGSASANAAAEWQKERLARIEAHNKQHGLTRVVADDL